MFVCRLFTVGDLFCGGHGRLDMVQSSGSPLIGLCLVSASLTLLLDGCTTAKGVGHLVSAW